MISGLISDTFNFLGGLIGIFENYGAYQRWVRTTSSRAKLFEEMLEMCNMINDPECPKSGKHRDLEASQIKKSEHAVKKIMEAISHPWKIADKERLYCLASGTTVSEEIEIDILRADELGETLKNTFIQERLKHGHEKHFFDPVRRQKLKTMEDNNKTVSLTTSQGKLIQYQNKEISHLSCW